MNLAGMTDIIGGFVAFFLTLMALSYFLGDNVLFRIVTSIFIGVAAGYAAVIVWYNVLLPHLILPLLGDRTQLLFALVPLILSGLLLTKLSPRLTPWGNPAMAYLAGVGAASVIGGAITGTIVPQVWASMNVLLLPPTQESISVPWLPMVNGVILLVGTVTTLAYFHFGARPGANRPPARLPWIEASARIGQVFVAVALVAIFAGVLAASIGALVVRVEALLSFVLSLVPLK